MNDQIVSLYDVMTGYANSALEVLPSIAIALVVLVLFFILARVGKNLVGKMAGRFVEERTLQSLFGTLTSTFIIGLGLFVAAAIVFPGLQAGDLVAVLGLSSVAVGFAFKDIFQNFLAGVLILSRRPFRIGDQIRSGDHEGRVEEISFRSTLLETYSGERVIVPNSEIFSNPVKVRTAHELRRSEFMTGISYDASIAEARKVIDDALGTIEGIASDPGPTVRAWEHGADSVNLQVRYWTKSEMADVVNVRGEVAERVKDALDDAEIGIPYPQRTLHFSDALAMESSEKLAA